MYRAADVNLGRHVAIKVLPPSWEHDPDRVARFTREPKALASLNHPNVAALHGFERAGDRRALVMELVEGPHARRPHRERRGQRFLALVPAPGRGDAGFTVLTNWQTTLNVR
jgi:serine/threonine protein kinase